MPSFSNQPTSQVASKKHAYNLLRPEVQTGVVCISKEDLDMASVLFIYYKGFML